MRVVGGAAFAVAVMVGSIGAESGRSLDNRLPETLLFARGDRMILMDGEGRNQRWAPFPAAPRHEFYAYPAYSPDGRRVTYVVARNLRSDPAESRFVSNGDGSHRRSLVSNASCLGPASWSPDSNKIAYTLHCEVDFMSILVVDRNGRHRKRLTGRWNFDPHWSSDGRTILFTSYVTRRGWRLFLMDANGRHRREIRGRYPSAENASYSAQWGRDGRKIFFLSEKQLFVVNADGSGLRNLSPPHTTIGDFDMSPDGRAIVFHGATGGDREIYVLSLVGGRVKQLTDNRDYDEFPVWSPDGAKIAFVAYRAGNAEIYVMNADGSDQRNLTRNPGVDDSPSWVPKSR